MILEGCSARDQGPAGSHAFMPSDNSSSIRHHQFTTVPSEGNMYVLVGPTVGLQPPTCRTYLTSPALPVTVGAAVTLTACHCCCCYCCRRRCYCCHRRWCTCSPAPASPARSSTPCARAGSPTTEWQTCCGEARGSGGPRSLWAGASRSKLLALRVVTGVCVVGHVPACHCQVHACPRRPA